MTHFGPNKLLEKGITFIIISRYGLALIGLYIFGAYTLSTSGTGLG